MTDLIIILLAYFSAWEEVQQLVQRGSWKREDYRVSIWATDWDGQWKIFDSHHVAFGLFVTTFFIYAYFGILTLWLVPVYIAVFWYLRNIFMHIVLKRKPLWEYLYRKF